MNEDGIVRICVALDLKFSRAYAGTVTWGSNMSIACPLAVNTHGDPYDDNMSCSIKVVDDGPSAAKCWSGNCKFKGSLLKLVRTAVSIRGNTPELLKLLKDVESVEALTMGARHNRTAKAIDKVWTPTPSNFDRSTIPERFFTPFANKIPQYALDRGITVETAKAWGLGYDKKDGFLVFPVRRRDSKLIGLVGRAVSDRAKRRHHNYMGLDKAKHLFGEHMLEVGKPVVIVEACIDGLNTWQALEKKACVVASLGEGFSDKHAKTISAMRPPFVYIFTDGDGAGRLMGSKIAYALHGLVTVKIMECPWGVITRYTNDGKAIREKIDPSVLPYSHIRKLYKDAPIVKKRIKWTYPPPVFELTGSTQ